MGTVQQELTRRSDCRFGLAGVEVSIKTRKGERFVVLGSSWDARGKLVLELLPKALQAEYQRDKDSYRKHGIPLFTCAELMEFCDRWQGRRLDDVPAKDAVLLTEWPIVCRCWCEGGEG